MRTAPDGYSIDVQTDLIYALSAIHNWILQHAKEREEEGLDPSSVLYDDDDDDDMETAVQNADEAIQRSDTNSAMDIRREGMAAAMWSGYQSYIA